MSKTESEDPNVVTHEVVGAPGQVADLFDVTKSDATKVLAVDKDGSITAMTMAATLGAGLNATYIIYRSGASYYAKNGNTGTILSSGLIASTVIQAVIDALEAAGVGGSIHFKAGIYEITTTLLMQKPIQLTGEGRGYFSAIGGTIFKATAAIATIFSLWEAGAGSSFYDFAIDGNSMADYGFKIGNYNTHRNLFINLSVENCLIWGISESSNHSDKWIGCWIKSNGIDARTHGGMIVGPDSYTNCLGIIDCVIEWNGQGMRFHSGYNSYIRGSVIEGNAYDGIYVEDDYPVTSNHNSTITDCYLETNNTAELLLQPIPVCDIVLEGPYAAYWTVRDCTIAGGGHCEYAMYVKGVQTILWDVRCLGPGVLWTNEATHGLIYNTELDAASAIDAKVIRIDTNLNVRESDFIVFGWGGNWWAANGLTGELGNLHVTAALAYDAAVAALPAGAGVICDKSTTMGTPPTWNRYAGGVLITAEKNLLSNDFAIDGVAVVTVTTAHGLTITPAIEDISVTIVESTNVDDWACGYVKVESVDATNVVCKVNVTVASVTGAAKAKLGIKIDAR